MAWESAEKMLKKWYDIGSVEEDMKDEFDKAYDEADEEEWWREKNFKNIR